MILLDPRFWLTLFVALGGAYATGRWQQYSSDQKTHTAEALKATEKARQTEANWQSDAAVAEGIHDEEIARINAQHLRDLDRLRNRAAKRLSETPAACAGSSPAALSTEDSAVVVGWGAEFDSLRAEYAKCKADAESVRLTDRKTP